MMLRELTLIILGSLGLWRIPTVWMIKKQAGTQRRRARDGVVELLGAFDTSWKEWSFETIPWWVGLQRWLTLASQGGQIDMSPKSKPKKKVHLHYRPVTRCRLCMILLFRSLKTYWKVEIGRQFSICISASNSMAFQLILHCYHHFVNQKCVCVHL